ncbi:UNKNOWN [Stylonychia lemnae]|uniref:Uncharacterized protein n=1 Tax=Stylonychia lemnae TaxID=5949 RepID=A0A078B7Y1_STYLE|nr:UNKNOWN [Stylonychia lemnae]|eukprot:CDW90504.1 UNKNOWN [Stylonychia lemnae]
MEFGMRLTKELSRLKAVAGTASNTASRLACSCSASFARVKAIFAFDTSALASEESTPAMRPLVERATALALKTRARSRFFSWETVIFWKASRFRQAAATLIWC